MTATRISRRHAIGSALAVAGSATVAACTASEPPASLNLEDPASRARIRAKINGSAAEETLHGLAKLDLYAYLNGGNVRPLMTMWNYTVTKWKPHSDTSYRMQHFESGIYTEFNSERVLDDYWDNPITGERREVWPFLAGPIKGEIGPDGTVTGPEATVHPEALGIYVLGDHVFLPAQSSFSFPNPFAPEQWPKESAGPVFYWDSFFTHSAPLREVADPSLDRVNTVTQFQNLVSWHPWLGMGGVDGKTFGRAFGTKLKNGFADVPEFVQAALEKQTPEILDIESWGEGFRNDFADYMKARGQQSPSDQTRG